METLFLLRSFGDFVIALHGCANEQVSRNVKLIASDHLKPLYTAIAKLRPIPRVEFIDLGISHNLMACFTNRYFFEMGTVRELIRLKEAVNNCESENGLWLEQQTRSSLIKLFTQQQFGTVHDGVSNIYTAYRNFFGSDRVGVNNEVSEMKKVVIFPGSRKVSKQLPVNWVDKLIRVHEKNGSNVIIAGLQDEIRTFNGEKNSIGNFDELLSLILRADHIISADSLPAHIAELFCKSHEVHYRNRINIPWITPGGKAVLIRKAEV